MTVPGTILVVDDEARSLEAIRRALARDFEVIGVRGPGEAEAVLAGELVQVVLCEQDMRGESGVAFLKRVREQWPDPVRLMLCGTAAANDIVAGAREAAVHQVIAKPWRPEQLIESVREATQLFRQQKVADAALGARIGGKAQLARATAPT